MRTLVDRGEAEGGCVFLKQITKFACLFDFSSNLERECPGGDAGRWGVKCLELFAGHDVVHRHVLLIRDPVAILSSWTGKSGGVHNNNTHPDEIGITKLMDIYSEVLGASMSGGDAYEPVVLDSDDLAWDPRSTLGGLCDSLGLRYTESMLKWEAGPHECDGPWARMVVPGRLGVRRLGSRQRHRPLEDSEVPDGSAVARFLFTDEHSGI